MLMPFEKVYMYTLFFFLGEMQLFVVMFGIHSRYTTKRKCCRYYKLIVNAYPYNISSYNHKRHAHLLLMNANTSCISLHIWNSIGVDISGSQPRFMYNYSSASFMSETVSFFFLFGCVCVQPETVEAYFYNWHIQMLLYHQSPWLHQRMIDS